MVVGAGWRAARQGDAVASLLGGKSRHAGRFPSAFVTAATCQSRRAVGRSSHITSTSTSTSTSNAAYDKVSHLLAQYPSFNLNCVGDGQQQQTIGVPLGPLGPQRGDEAILTLSGGVDSSVAAFMAMEKGGLVPARTIFMRNWNSLEEQRGFAPGAGGAEGCTWKRDWERVQRMATWLHVEPELMDLSAQYWNAVFSPSLDEWSAGLTPNPDVLCNTEIKFGELLRRLDADGSLVKGQHTSSPSFGRRLVRRWLVTGHYADVQYYLPAASNIAGPAPVLHGRLYRAADTTKDQSYFLSGVGALQLGRTHFPLANTCKTDVRRLARLLGMPTAESEESMGLCFIGERRRRPSAADAVKGSTQQEAPAKLSQSKMRGRPAEQLGFAGFLGEYLDARPGPIITEEGEHASEHQGLHTLTIGQRARVGGAKQRYFVAAKDAENNAVLVVPGSDHPWLQCHALEVDAFHLIAEEDAEGAMLDEEHPYHTALHAQIRHRSEAVPCHATWLPAQTAPAGSAQNDASSSIGAGADVGDRDGTQEMQHPRRSLRVTFAAPVSSVAEGQVCALYAGRHCLGSGVIARVDTAAPHGRLWARARALPSTGA